MKYMLKSLVFVGAAMLLSSCAPDPNDTCAHLEELYKNSAEPPAYLKSREACTELFNSRKKRNGVNSYRRESECILKTKKLFNIRECMTKEDNRKD